MRSSNKLIIVACFLLASFSMAGAQTLQAGKGESQQKNASSLEGNIVESPPGDEKQESTGSTSTVAADLDGQVRVEQKVDENGNPVSGTVQPAAEKKSAQASPSRIRGETHTSLTNEPGLLTPAGTPGLNTGESGKKPEKQ